MKTRTTRTTRTIVFALLTALVMMPAALADYPMFGLDPGRTADAPGYAPVTDNLIWSTDVSSGSGGYIGCGASVVDGRVYVSNWPTMTGGTGLGLHCLDESDGSIIWDNPMGGSGGVSTPAVTGGLVFAGDYLGDLYCVNANDGTTNWNMSVEPTPAWWGLASSPLIYDGMVYVVSFSDGTMHAIDFDGVEQWNYSASGASDTYMSVATDGSKLFFGGGNAMNCVDIATQTAAWTFAVGDKVTTTPAACDGVVYFATGSGEKKLYAVDIATGNEVWNRSLYGSLSSPAISDGKIYIGDKDQQINCIYASNGTTLWTQTIGGSCLSSPVVANGMAYTTSNSGSGTIYGFDAGDGTLKWTYDTGNWNMAQPSVSDGILFVGSDTGYLYAFSNMAWDGEVDLTSGTVNVTANNSGKEYTISSTCAMYALVKSAEKGGFNYSISDAWYDDYGSLYFDMINDRYESGYDGWLYWVNYPDGASPTVGANTYELVDGDVMVWYWGSGMGATPSNSDMLIQARVGVTEPPTVVWDGSVNLTPATVNVTADNSGEEYTISSTCAMYALVKAAEKGGFNYSINDDWYVTYGSLYFDMINDSPAEGWDGWSYWVNYPDDPMPMVGANSYELDDADVVTWYWSSSMDANPGNTDMLIRIEVAKLLAICLGECYPEPDCEGTVTAMDIPCWECIGILGDSWKPTTDCGCDLTCPEDACYNFCPECCDGFDNDGDGNIDCPYDEGCACCCDFTECDSDPAPCVPELPSIVLISVGLLMLAGYVRMRRKD